MIHKACLAVLTLPLILSLPLPAQEPPRQTEVKVQRTSMSREQESQLGKQYAAQVEREMQVVHQPEIEAWLNRIGQNLARTPQSNAYPYYFKLVNDDSINAFALPGGPMYVHTGLLKAAASEGEVAGVLAHEMSHVALRHSAAQMGKQQTYGTLFSVLGAAAGMATSKNGQCGLLCQVTQIGAGIGGNSVLMKFSRGYERDADLNGARMMASAGYDPMQLPQFFEKLESSQGSASEPKGLALWLSSHPGTGSRIETVQEDIQFYPKRAYTAGTGNFAQIKKLLATIGPAKPQPGKLIQPKEDAPARAGVPSGFEDYAANGFRVAHPANWQAGQPENGGSLYLLPDGGAVESQKGGVELIYGAMIDYYTGPTAANLATGTRDFVAALQKGDGNLRAGKPVAATVGGKPALLTRLTTRCSYEQDPDQVVYLYTVARESGLWYMVLATPSSRTASFEPLSRQIARTVQFPN